MRKIHYFEDGGPSDGGADNTNSAFNNNNTNDNTNNTPADNTPSAPADRNADVADAQIRQDAQDTQSTLQALAPMGFGFKTTPANEQALRNQEIVRSFLAQVAKDKETSRAKPGEEGNFGGTNYGSSVANALDAARASGINITNFTQQGGKSGVERNVESKSTNIPIASFLGYTGDPGNSAISYNEAKMMKALGAGDFSGVNLNNLTGTGLSVADANGNPWSGFTMGNIGQDANSVVAATDAAEFAGKLFDVAKLFIPGYGAIEFMANLLTGKMTLGQAATSLLGYRAATLLGVSPAVFGAAASGQYGNGIAAYANGVLNSVVSKETGTDPRLTGVLMNTTGTSGLTRSIASPLNVGPNFSGALAGTIDSALSNIGIGKGPSENSVNVPNLGTDTKSQADNIMNSNRMSPTTAPVSLDGPATSSAPSSPLSSAGSSSGSYAGASPDMSTLGTTNGLYRVGNTNYTPYKQDLAQLNLAPDEFTKQSDIGNIPVYNTDIAKMASAPFMQSNDPFAQYAAAGGSIRHFSGEDGSHVTADSAPAPTAEQLEQRAALQAQAEYYKNLDAEKQNADIMTALKNLSGVGAAEAKPQSSPLLRLGQVGNYTPPKVLPQLAALLQSRGMRLAEGGQPEDHKHPNYDGTPVFRTGGLSGLGGKYVEGKGDGTSDDITAMLADGEYVFSADVVSALGNGSNKAGAQVLDKTVEAIRSRARSAPPDKLPPDAKSPLEYMQAVKGKKYG